MPFDALPLLAVALFASALLALWPVLPPRRMDGTATPEPRASPIRLGAYATPFFVIALSVPWFVVGTLGTVLLLVLVPPLASVWAVLVGRHVARTRA